jgi:hypothetical protein
MVKLGLFAFVAVLLSWVHSEEAPAEPAEPAGEEDATTSLMKQLTIAMASEVVDERTFAVRDAASKGRKLIRLGNVAPIEKGSLTEEEYQERVEAGKAALSKLVEKQMMLWKAAPEEHQPKSEDEDLDGELIIADAWTVDGRHMPTLLKKEGHLVASPMYESELAKDILSAAADEEKREAYKKLEEALKESEAAKAAQRAEEARAQQALEDAENAEPIGLGGWIGLGVVAILVVGVLTNFGRQDKKKVNLNRKKGLFEKLSGKLSGKSQ